MSHPHATRFTRKTLAISLVLAAASADAQENETVGVSSDSISVVTGDEIAPGSPSQCDVRNLRPPTAWRVSAQTSIAQAVAGANRCLAQRDTTCAETALSSVAGQIRTDDEKALVAIPQAELAKQRGDDEAASRIYQEAVELPSVGAALRLELVRMSATLQHGKGQYADVLRLLNTNFSCSTWTADALTLRAMAYEGLFASRLALESFEGAMNLYQLQGRPLPAGLEGHYQALAARHDPTREEAADVVPLVRVNPDYPQAALRRGREGWVQMEFDITDMGTVANARVVDSSDAMFDEAALASLRRWRYAPKFIDGLPVLRTGVQTRIVFNLEL